MAAGGKRKPGELRAEDPVAGDEVAVRRVAVVEQRRGFGTRLS
jgi:hypothetical protein